MLSLGIAFLWAQALLWKIDLPSNARVSLLPDGNILVLANKGVYALSATNGQRLWECSACQRFAPNEWGPIGAYPLWEAGSLLSLSPDVPSDSLQRIISWWSLQGYLVLNATNGRVVFDSRNNEGWQGVYGRAVLPSQGLLVIFGIGSKDPGKFLSLQTSILAAYDVRTGQLKWRRPAGDKAAAEQLHSNLVAYDGKIYFLTNRALYAVDAATGNTLWRHEIVKGLSLRPTTGTYLFIDEEKDWVVAFGRGRVTAVRRSDGQPVWQKPISIPRDNILHAFSTSQGILLFTDDVSPGSPERPTGNNIFMPPLAVLLSYENGANVWGERISTPGLLVGYIPLDENRLLCLFQRERLQRSNLRSPADNWKVEVDVLDLQRGRFLFKRPISLKGALLHAQTVPGGFLVQTVRRLQYISEEGQVLWEKPIKRPFSLPFAVREAGGTFQAFLIDETGQVFRWDGPPTEPRPIGQKLTAFQNDPPQGIAYEQGKLWIWGGSTLYAIDPEGKVECEFARPVPAQPAALRLLGAAISIAGYATSAYLGYKALQTVAYEPERSWDRPDVATTLKKVLTATAYSFGALGAYVIGEAAWTALVEARQARMKEVENLAFLLGMENSKVFLYAIDKLSCEVKLRRELGSLPLFMNPQYELDPIERRLFVVEERSLHAYAF